MRALLLPAALAAGLFLPSSCTSPQPPPPNILILLMDTLRADRLGCYGYGRSTSSVIDSLAAGGTLFTRCYAPSDYTQASTASLFTGQYPLAHGYVNSNYVLEESNLTMAEIYAERGYRTAAFIANGLAGRKYRMDQGFHEHFESNRAPASELAEAAKEFIEGRPPRTEAPPSSPTCTSSTSTTRTASPVTGSTGSPTRPPSPSTCRTPCSWRRW